MNKNERLKNFATRLRTLRENTQLNQTKFAKIGGVAKKSQMSYEKGDRTPSAKYLMALHDAGFDTHYLLTGESRL